MSSPVSADESPRWCLSLPIGRQHKLSKCPIFAFSCCPFSHALWTAISKFSFFISSRLLALWYYTLVSALVSTQAVLIGTRSHLCASESTGAFSAGHSSGHRGHLCSLLCPWAPYWAAGRQSLPVSHPLYLIQISTGLHFYLSLIAGVLPCSTLLSSKLALWTSEF